MEGVLVGSTLFCCRRTRCIALHAGIWVPDLCGAGATIQHRDIPEIVVGLFTSQYRESPCPDPATNSLAAEASKQLPQVIASS